MRHFLDFCPSVMLLLSLFHFDNFVYFLFAGVPENLEFLNDLEAEEIEDAKNCSEANEIDDCDLKEITETNEESSEHPKISEENEQCETNTEEETLNPHEIVEKFDELDIDTEPDFDAILENAFLRACKTMPKKTEFPLLTSNFFRTFIIPNCPPNCSNLDVKKTKWKKLSKFLAEQQTDGLITLKEQKKGVEMITAINMDHQKIIDYKVIKYENLDSNTENNEKAGFEPPIITELYIVNGGDVAHFFKGLN